MLNPKLIQEAKTQALAKASGVTDTANNLLSSGNLANLKLGVENGIKEATGEIRNIANGLPGDLGINTAQLGDLTSMLPGDIQGLANKALGVGSILNDPQAFFQDKLDQNLASITNQLNSAISIVEGVENAFAQGQLGAAAFAAGINLDVPYVNKGDNSNVGSLSQAEQKAPGIAKDSYLENQLRKYASFNTIFKFGAISANSVNFPDSTYLVNGADVSILQSGGGGIDNKRVMTIYDALGQSNGLPGRLEYFIDEFEIEALVAPNKRTGMTQAMPMSFKVHEPYSMGLFLQSLQAAALEAGFANYLKAPFMLELDFIGYDDDGNAELVEHANRKIPLSLTAINFDVERAGSVYEITAVPYNEVSLMDEIQKIPDPVKIVGTTLLEALSLGEQALTTVINTALEKVATAKNQSATDYYMIRFPTRRTSANGLQMQGIGSSSVNQATTTELEEARSRLGSELQEVVEGQLTGFFDSVGTGTSGSALFENLKTTAVSDVSAIGAALLKLPDGARSDSPFGLERYNYDPETGIFKRDGVELTLLDGVPSFTFDKGSSIQSIIEELVTVSSYGRESIFNADSEGMIRWYKIEPQCFIIPDKEIEKLNGKPARIFVYNIVPYEVHSSTFPSPASTHSAENRKKQIVKEYNYIYSGQNEDVLAFDIKFNAAFFEAIQGDFGELSAGEQTKNVDNIVAANGVPAYNIKNIPGRTPETVVQPVSTALTYTGGGYNLDKGAALAKQFQRALLESDVDLIVAELEIWGDPYYVPSSGLGNYNAANSGQTTSLTVDGSLDYQRSEVDILINFKTPIDYGPDGYAIFPGGELATQSVGQFSGVYKVLKVVTTIRENQFVQTLSLIRRKNQEDYFDVIPAAGADAIGEDQNAQSLNSDNEVQTPEVVGNEGTSGAPQGGTARPSQVGSSADLAEIRSKSGQRALVAKVVQENFQALVDELEDEYGYDIRSMGGYRDPNRTGGVNTGSGTYSRTNFSWHNSGLALDINPGANPFIKPRPSGGVDDYTDMPEAGTGSLMSALAAKHGLGWGGDWTSSVDAMHFSAGANEGGTYANSFKNGTIPKSPDTTNYPDQPPPGSPPPAGTGSMDAAAASSQPPVAGTSPVTQEQQTVSPAPAQSNQVSSTDLRPYLPLTPRDNRYDYLTGDKVRSILQNNSGGGGR
jgi:hypothetical protein